MCACVCVGDTNMHVFVQLASGGDDHVWVV